MPKNPTTKGDTKGPGAPTKEGEAFVPISATVSTKDTAELDIIAQELARETGEKPNRSLAIRHLCRQSAERRLKAKKP